MNFASTVDVQRTEKSELFNAVTVWVPQKYAANNIVDWDQIADELSETKPVVLTTDVSNYADIMKGTLLSRWINAFRQDSNIDLVVFLVIFDDTQSGAWTIGAKSIDYAPLTYAFERLFHISYLKILFDETMDGAPVVIPFAGSKAKRTISITNGTGATHTLLAGTYLYNDGEKDFQMDILADMAIAAGDSVTGIIIEATTVGVDSLLATGAMDVADFAPALTGGAELLTFATTAIVQGAAADPSPAPVDARYFDLALALAQLCKTNISMSYFWSMVRVHLSQSAYPVASDVDTNKCWITSKGKDDQVTWMTALNKAATIEVPIPRTNYYWGALYLLDAINTMVVVHSEDVDVLTEVLGAWFGARNASGNYVANKLSVLRLTGANIKPLGYPSWLNSAVNENFGKAFDRLDEMNVGYLYTISNRSTQESILSAARGVTGYPCNALMISKFIDYKCRNDAANMLTDTSTLTDPTLTDPTSYEAIQEMVKNNVLAFVPTRRIVNVKLDFPPFAKAKTGMTRLEAASAWHADYVDDLDEVAVTGGITAQ